MSNKQKIRKPEIIRVFRNGAQARLTLLHHLIDQYIVNQDANNKLKLPKKITSKLSDEIAVAGGPENWIILQPGFNQIVKKKRFQLSLKDAQTKDKNERIGESRDISTPDQTVSLPQDKKSTISPIITEEKIIAARLATLVKLLKKAVDPTKALTIPRKTPSFIIEEIQAAPSIADWMKSHPDFDLHYQRMLKKPTATPDYKKFYNSTKSLSKEEVIKLGYKRISVEDAETPFNKILELVIAVGSLPSPPKLIEIKGKQQINRNGQLVHAWKTRMTAQQIKIWNTITAENRSTYLKKGKIYVGKRVVQKKLQKTKTAPIGNASKEFIERLIEKTSSSDFDIKKIDWNTT